METTSEINPQQSTGYRTLVIMICVGVMLLVIGGGVWYTMSRRGITQNIPQDSDRDLLSDADESKLGTDKNNPDTDGDGLTDYQEIKLGLDPKNGHSLSAQLKDGTVIVQKQLDEEREERIKNLK